MTDELIQPDEITADFVPERRESVASIEIETESLVFDEDRGSWHYLNPMARVIWDCCDGTGTVEEIARDISEVFEANLDTVRESVLETLRQFGDQGLLEGVEQTVQPDAHGHVHDHDEDEDGDGRDHDTIQITEKPSAEGPSVEEPRFLAVPPSS